MKKLFLVLPLLGLLIVGCEKKSETATEAQTLADKSEKAVKDAAEMTKAAAIDAKDAVGDKLVEWKLTPSDLKADFEKGGRIVRSKAAVAGARTGEVFDNARIVTVLNAKLLADSRLSALKINVDADAGVVTLKGTVKSIELIGHAIRVALDTDGVNQVVSLLTLQTP